MRSNKIKYGLGILVALVGSFLVIKNINGPLNVHSLKTYDNVVGSGSEAVKGKVASIKYTIWNSKGEIIESSKQHNNQPYVFTIGEDHVLKGWSDGIIGMKVGGKRKILIPSELAFGTKGVGNIIQANESLSSEIELVKIE